jgi:sulfur transfer complex TusBCD TusB component (DsrH family)
MAAVKTAKVECLNPNTGGRMNIDKPIYDLFYKAIYDAVKRGKAITFTQITDGVNDYLKKQKKQFDSSIGWYAITVKHDMHARGILKVYTEKGKKLHSIA